VLNIAHDRLKVGDYINAIIKQEGYHLPFLSDEVCRNILQNTVVEAFANSSVFSDIKNFEDFDRPLNVHSWDLHSSFTNYRNFSDEPRPSICDKFSISDLPTFMAHRAVMRIYDDLEKKLHLMDTTGQEWTLAMKTFALPRTDKSILDKGDYLVAKASLIITKLINERMVLLEQFPQLLM